MDQDPPIAAAPVPGDLTQPGTQDPKPMEVDGAARGPLTQEEQEQWDALEQARAADLGMEMAAELTTAKEEAAAKGAPRDVASPGVARSPNKDRIARRAAGRSPYKKREDEEGDGPSLAPVREEAEAAKVPSDGEGEDEEDPEQPEDAKPEEE